MPNAYVVFNTGQSNSQAYGTGGQAYPGGWPHGGNVKIFSTNNQAMETYLPTAITDFSPPNSGNQFSYWGPEAGFVDSWLRAYPGDQLYIVKRLLIANAVAPPNWCLFYFSWGWQKFIEDITVATTLIKAAGFTP